MESNAKWDWSTRIITTFVLLLVLVLATKEFNRYLTTPSDSYPVRFIIIFLVAIAFLLTFLYSIKKYRLTNDSLEIVRFLNKKTIPLSSIKAVHILNNSDMVWTIRLFGSGGLFGYIGYFWNFKHKFISVYATRLSPLVMLVTSENKKLIISPEEYAFVEALEKHIIYES
jgi:hypothetical protein